MLPKFEYVVEIRQCWCDKIAGLAFFLLHLQLLPPLLEKSSGNYMPTSQLLKRKGIGKTLSVGFFRLQKPIKNMRIIFKMLKILLHLT
jgi:hypothetical protein